MRIRLILGIVLIGASTSCFWVARDPGPPTEPVYLVNVNVPGYGAFEGEPSFGYRYGPIAGAGCTTSEDVGFETAEWLVALTVANGSSELVDTPWSSAIQIPGEDNPSVVTGTAFLESQDENSIRVVFDEATVCTIGNEQCGAVSGITVEIEGPLQGLAEHAPVGPSQFWTDSDGRPLCVGAPLILAED